MTALVIARGLPGSGKTTAARNWVAEDPEKRVRVNRDDYRMMLHGVAYGLTNAQENHVTAQQQHAARMYLADGTSVIVDDTNLKLRYARAWASLAVETGADFSVLDIDTPLGECIARDAVRAAAGGRGVGWEAISDLGTRYATRPAVLPSERRDVWVPEFYEPDPSLPPAWIIDIDGTVARKQTGEGARGWHQYHRVAEDEPIQAILDLVAAIRDTEIAGVRPAILFMSGRAQAGESPEGRYDCEAITSGWLWEHLGEFDALFMRAEGDQRDDTIVKAELFDANVRGKYDVIGAVDDRPKVCRMWRAMGLRVVQVGDPHVEF